MLMKIPLLNYFVWQTCAMARDIYFSVMKLLQFLITVVLLLVLILKVCNSIPVDDTKSTKASRSTTKRPRIVQTFPPNIPGSINTDPKSTTTTRVLKVKTTTTTTTTEEPTLPTTTEELTTPEPPPKKSSKGQSLKKFPKCVCFQKIRTSYITNNPCGKAALCFYEISNYKKKRAKALRGMFKNETTDPDGCSEYLIQKYACLIGYPQPQQPHPICEQDYEGCMRYLSKMLYDDCEPLRKERGLRKPQEVNPKIRIDSLNYNLNYDPEKNFLPRPNSAQPTHNNFYELSCPVIYRFPYFTIDLLLKYFNPNTKYDETKGLKKVAAMLPKYVRLGVDRERIINFEALGVDENEINWCGIPRNYVCIREDLDVTGDVCKYETIEEMRQICEPDMANPRQKPLTVEVLAP